MRIVVVLASAFLLVGCPQDSCDTGTNPTDITTTTTTTTTEDDSDSASVERCDREPNLHNIHIFTFFAAPLTYDSRLGWKQHENFEQQYITRVSRYMLERGFNTARIGAETFGWCNADTFYLPCGPEPGTDEWRERLIGTLEITARIPGLYVQLIPTFTIKGEYHRDRILDAVHETVRIVQSRGYRHVIWSAYNEFWHPSTLETDESMLISVLQALPHPRGADFPDNGGDGSSWRGVKKDAMRYCDYAAFHPSRNPEPTVEAYRATMGLVGKPVIFDETVCWLAEHEISMVNLGRGLYATTQEQVVKQQHALRAAGAGCSFHALWLFSYDERIDWAPRCP